MRDDRHERLRRATPDRRRRPVDGFRVRDRQRFASLMVTAVGQLPEALLVHLDGTELVVEDLPPPGDDVEVPLGSYRGPGTCAPDGSPLPQRVTVYRRPIEARALDRAEVAEIIRVTVLHEVADHLGIDEDRREQLGWD